MQSDNPHAIKQKCNAKTRQGDPCNNWAMGNGRCRMHGGKTPRGLALPQTKTGLYSKDLPTRLSSNYEALLNLGDSLWQIADEAAAITALTQQALSGIDNGESGAAWRQIAELHQEMETINRKPDRTKEDMAAWGKAFEQIGQISRNKSMAYAARDEAVRLMEVKRRFVADERKARTEAHKVMTYDRVMLIMAAIIGGFKQSLERYTDIDTRNRILEDSQRIVGRVLGE